MKNTNNNLLDKLKKYFETTQQDKIQEDWNKSKEFDKICITIDNFLINTENEITTSRNR